jgi:hypothetical protein
MAATIKPDDQMEPDIKILMDEMKSEIFATMNCIQIGRVESVNLSEQTVEAAIQVRRQSVDGSSIAYPVLVDVPFFVLQGGQAYIDMPITAGDYCLILFNDRNIDRWWATANVAEPATSRKHSLSDGIALVGINPKTQVRDIDGNNARIFGPEIHLNGNSKTLVTHAELDTALQAFKGSIDAAIAGAIVGHTHPVISIGAPTGPGAGAAPPTSLDISASATTTIKTGG